MPAEKPKGKLLSPLGTARLREAAERWRERFPGPPVRRWAEMTEQEREEMRRLYPASERKR